MNVGTARARIQNPSLYETDVHRWASEQARAMRDGRSAGIDWDNVAEEIESLGRSDRRALESHLEVLFAHLLKCLIQPGRRTRSWDLTIAEQRDEIAWLMGRSPSLRHWPAEEFEGIFRRALRLAARDTGLSAESFPAQSPFTLEQALDPEFIPDGRTPR